MTRLEMILSAILLLSGIFNIIIYIYARETASRLLAIAEELSDLQSMIDSFTQHLQSVYELEMFYGDETLGHLMEHAESFNEQMGTFEHVYGLVVTEDDMPTEEEEPEEADASTP